MSARATLWAMARLMLVIGGAVLVTLGAAAIAGPGLVARVLAVMGVGAGVAWVAARWWAERPAVTEDAAARLVGRRVDEVSSDLLSVVQLRREAAGPAPLFSAAMLTALTERTARRLHEVRPADIVSGRELRRPAWIGLGAALAVGTAAWLAKPTLAIVAGIAEPPAEIVAEPLLGDLTVRYAYPEHTGRAPRTVQGSDGTLLGPRGTEVRVGGASARPLREAELLLDGQSAPVSVGVSGTAIEFRIVLRRSGSYRVRARLRGGRRVIERESRSIIVEADESPRVDLRAPADDLEVDGQVSVPLAYTAEDDFGLTALDLVWRSGQGEQTRIPIATRAPMPPRLEGETKLELMAPDLGEPVSYWLEAADNDTVSGPKRARSRTFYVRLRRDGDRRENALAAQSAAFERAVVHLADRLEIDPGQTTAVPLIGRLNDLVHAIGAARKATGDDRFAPKGLLAALGEMHDRLLRLLRAEARSSARAVKRKLVAELERDVIELDRWIARQRVEELMASADRIRRDRERLSERLARLSAGDEAERAEIAHELAALERRLHELLARAGKLSRELPHEYLNADAVGRDLLTELAEAREMLAAGDIEGAKSALARLGESLDQAMAALESGPGGREVAARRRALAEALEEVARLGAEQRLIASETADVEARAEGARDEEAFVKEQREKAERLLQALGEVPDRALEESDREALEQAQARAEALAESLGRRDLLEALGEAQGARDRLADRSDELKPPYGIAREIAADLEQALAEPSVSPADRDDLGELARRQEDTQGRAEKLSERIGKLSQDAPALGEAAPTLREAGRDMRRGAASMRRGHPRAGHRAAQDAADRLASLEQSLREARRSRGTGRGAEREPVDVPGAEAFRVPREWREQILEAMKEGAPQGYREMVRRYYRELIK